MDNVSTCDNTISSELLLEDVISFNDEEFTNIYLMSFNKYPEFAAKITDMIVNIYGKNEINEIINNEKLGTHIDEIYEKL